MIDLKAQLYWARVERWIAAALLLEVSILLNTQRDSANSLYSGAPYPTQSLKKPPPKKGWRLFWVMHQDLPCTWLSIRKADI